MRAGARSSATGRATATTASSARRPASTPTIRPGSGARGSVPIGYATPDGNSTLGAYGGTCDLAFIGDLDEVSIWKKALPVAEIWRKASIFFAPH